MHSANALDKHMIYLYMYVFYVPAMLLCMYMASLPMYAEI